MINSAAANNTVKLNITVRNKEELKTAFINLFRQVVDDEILVINVEEAEYGEEENRYSSPGLGSDVTG